MRLVKVFVVALVALLISSMGLAAPAGANVDQCAPPGVESASALPTNLAAAAQGPGADRYTTTTVEPLTAVNVNALGLGVPGTLTVGTLSDAPPSICINSAGQFTGFDNELLRAIAERLGLKINFVGTEFSGLLAQVASRRFDVGSSSITTTDARRRTVGFTNGYDFGYFSLVVPSGSPITGFDKLAAGQRIGVVQGTVQEAYVIDTLHLEPVKFPDYNTVYASLKTRQIDAWVAPSQQASDTVQPGDPAQIIENTFSLDNFVAWAVAKENQPLIDALNSELDAIIADGTWARLYSDWVPRALPPGWKPGSKAAPAPQLPDFAAIAAENQRPTSQGAAPKSTLSQLRDSFLNWDLYKQAIPDLFKTGLPNTLILTVSASLIGLVLGMALAVAGISRSRWLRWPARVYADIFRGLRERIGMVFQHFNLFPHRSVLDNVALAPRKLKRLGAEQSRELGLEQLDRVGLRHKADVRPGTLSGGQQQRVAIARALAMSPQVMFFDEATSALDPELVKGILALIADLGADGMTMVVVTHEMGFARSTSDAVVFMDHGQVVESGPPEQVFEAAETDRLRRFLSQVL